MTDLDYHPFSKIAVRSQWLVTTCLAIVVMVLAIALALTVDVASNAQDVAERQVIVAEELQIELACRYAIGARSTSAQADVISLVAATIVLNARGQKDKLPALIDKIDAATVELQAATSAGVTAIEDCAREKSMPGGS